MNLIQTQHASKFIAESALKHKENLSITTFGPLTNLAIAFHYEYKVRDIGTVSLLGGQYTGVGNVVDEYSAEANFHFDPHATHIIIHVSVKI
jgi:inosine-uridine nucleoside N-ribohydrolase